MSLFNFRKSKTVIDREPDVEAIICFNGTRKGPVFNGYRPGHRVTDDYTTTGLHHYIDVDKVNPNESAKATITFITPEYYPHCLWVGKMIDICEGGRVVGTAEITKIFNSVLEK